MSTLTGIDEVKFAKDLHRLQATIEKKAGGLVKGPLPRAMRAVGEIWMTEAKRRTPVKYGVLRSSGHVEGPAWDGKYLTIILKFGGPAASYAASVHENLKAKHKVGQSKYLESVIKERRAGWSREVASFIP